jgi:hypothetical protein
MAIKVRVPGGQGVKVVSTSRAESGGTLAALADTDVGDLDNGYILVYNESETKWKSQSNLPDELDIDGGAF